MEVIGFEDYLIYDDGRVFSQKRNKFLKEVNDKIVYKLVDLWKGKGKKFLIHRLVALHYIPNPENKSDVDHIDGDKANNHVSNLRWATRLENCNGFRKFHKNNKSGIKNISYNKSINRWRYQKTINKKIHTKHFKTLEETIQYKKTYEGH